MQSTAKRPKYISALDKTTKQHGRDPDFTKLTPEEKVRLEQAEAEIAAGEYVRHEDINWD